MGFDHYQEQPHELPAQTPTFARMCISLTDEPEAIGSYQQRRAFESEAAVASTA